MEKIKQEIEKHKACIMELEKELEKREQRERVFPQDGDNYWYISDYGQIEYQRDYMRSGGGDFARFRLGNTFRTEDDALFELERRKVEAELKRFADKYNEGTMDWRNPFQDKWYIVYDHERDNFNFSYTQTWQKAAIHFTSIEVAKQAIEEIGEERIKKYYLGVEQNGSTAYTVVR
ncbi:MAG: hypothetical protein WC292_00255 [Clostridia bacterium]